MTKKTRDGSEPNEPNESEPASVEADGEPEIPANVCMCACHQHPEAYPTSEETPCSSCKHVNDHGKLIGDRKGWKPTKRGK